MYVFILAFWSQINEQLVGIFQRLKPEAIWINTEYFWSIVKYVTDKTTS